jgi:NTE family protein
LHYDGLYKSGILVNLTQKKTFLRNDVASLDVVLGDNFRYNFDYYIDNGFHWSFGLKSNYNLFTRNVTTDFKNGLLLSQMGIKAINIDYSDFSNQAYVQTVSLQKFLLGIGLEYKMLKIKSETLLNTTPILENSNYWSTFGYLKYDSFDNKYFPKSGWIFASDFQSYLFSSDFTNQFNRFSIAKADVGLVKTFYKKATIKLQTGAGLKIGDASVPFFDFILGGYGFNPVNNIKQFYGYDFLSISGNSYIKAGFTLDYEIFKKNHLNFSGNYAQVEDNLFENSDWLTKPKYSGYALGYGLETVIGPVEVKYTWSPELSKGYTLFTIGFWF